MSIRLFLAGLTSMAVAAAITLIIPAAPATAAPATACAAGWTSSSVYTGGMTASLNGHNYTAKWWTQGEQPPGSSGVWTDDGTCSGSSGGGGGTGSCSYPQWAAGTNYVTGDIVQYPANGQYYQATHDNPGYDPTISTWYWSPYTCGGGGTTPPPGGFVVSEAQFDQMFPSRNSFYTYDGLVSAMSAYPGFATTGGDTVEKQEAAAFLANVSHETGGLVYISEIDQSGNYCASESYGCPAGTYSYYGRGPLQISWNFNYYAAGNAIGVDLLDNPNLVATDSATSWKTALWYWDTQTGPGTMTGHNAMVNGAGFGQTIWSINGSIECNGGNTAEMQDRVNLYEQYTSILGVPAGNNLTC
ncbi:MAG TPA: glycoside hydrolase family 19 protein [Pseudonocardiaceae bacterium]|jgi:predicted chitinase|nr:glycoside hydrolase family 19 protein [Pseudonocardiaceae bacterium]